MAVSSLHPFAALNPREPPHPHLLAQQFHLIQPLPNLVPHDSSMAHHLRDPRQDARGGFWGQGGAACPELSRTQQATLPLRSTPQVREALALKDSLLNKRSQESASGC